MNIIAGVCLLLWGVALLKLGMTRGLGADLRRFLSKATANRFKAFAAGLGVTALLQSSTATVMIVAGFAGQGMITAGAGLAIVLGADVGTTLVAQVLSMDLRLMMPVLMVGGYILFSIEHNGKIKNVGRVFVGLSLMLLALGLIKTAAEPLRDSETLPLILAPLEKDLIFAVVVAALLTWIAHSSLAIILLLMSLVAAGVVPLMLGLAMVLGVNIGGTIAPLIATLRDQREAMRIPLGNLMIRVTGVLIAAPFLPYLQSELESFAADPGRQIVNFHTAFNLCLALAFLPFIQVIGSLLERILPSKAVDDDPGRPMYLDRKDLDTPAIALSDAKRETLRMADVLEQMLVDVITVLKTDDAKLLEKIREEDDILDRLYLEIKSYMAEVTQEFMDPKDVKEYMQILMFSTNIEHAGDVIDRNLLPLARKKIRNKYQFSEAGMKEIEHIHALVVKSVQLAQSVFMSGDIDLARTVVQDKTALRQAEMEGMALHMRRLRDGVPETMETSALHLDIIRDLRRVNTYILTVAYPILEEEGQLSESRLKDHKPKGDE